MDILKVCIEKLKEDKKCVDIAIARLETLAQSRGLITLNKIEVKHTLQLTDGKHKRSVALQ